MILQANRDTLLCTSVWSLVLLRSLTLGVKWLFELAYILSQACGDNASKASFFLLCSTLSVGLDKIKTEDTKESKIKVGEEGLKIAKKIGEEMKRAVDNGSLTLTINGTVLLPDKQSLEIMEPKPLCSKGQTLKGTYCCKFLEIMHLHRDAFSRLT